MLDSVRVFVWIESLDQLVHHLLEIEPRVHALKPGDGLEQLQTELELLTRRIASEGLTESLRIQVTAATSENFAVDWWGTFEDLLAGESEFTRAILDGFLDEDRQGDRIRPDEMGEFVEHLKTCAA